MRVLQEAAQTTAIVVTAPPLPLDARDLNPKVMADPVRMRMLSRQVLWTRDVCRVPNVQVALRLPDPSSGLAFRRDTPMLGNMAWDAASRAELPRDDIKLLRHASDTLDVCTQFQPAPGFQRVASYRRRGRPRPDARGRITNSHVRDRLHHQQPVLPHDVARDLRGREGA